MSYDDFDEDYFEKRNFNESDYDLLEIRKGSIQYLFESYDEVYQNQEDTQKLVTETIENLLRNSYMSEIEIIQLICEKAKLHVPLFVGQRIIAECFLFLYNYRKAMTLYFETDHYDSYEYLIISHLNFLNEKLTLELAEYMTLTCKGKCILPVLHVLHNFGELLYKVENLKHGSYKSPKLIRKQNQFKKENNDISYLDDFDDMNEVLYWNAVGDGEIDPSEPRGDNWSVRLDYDDFDVVKECREELKESHHILTKYFNLIYQASDIDDVFKQKHLKSLITQFEGFINVYTMHEVLKKVNYRIADKNDKHYLNSSKDTKIEEFNKINVSTVNVAIEEAKDRKAKEQTKEQERIAKEKELIEREEKRKSKELTDTFERYFGKSGNAVRKKNTRD